MLSILHYWYYGGATCKARKMELGTRTGWQGFVFSLGASRPSPRMVVYVLHPIWWGPYVTSATSRWWDATALTGLGRDPAGEFCWWSAFCDTRQHGRQAPARSIMMGEGPQGGCRADSGQLTPWPYEVNGGAVDGWSIPDLRPRRRMLVFGADQEYHRLRWGTIWRFTRWVPSPCRWRWA